MRKSVPPSYVWLLWTVDPPRSLRDTLTLNSSHVANAEIQNQTFQFTHLQFQVDGGRVEVLVDVVTSSCVLNFGDERESSCLSEVQRPLAGPGFVQDSS